MQEQIIEFLRINPCLYDKDHPDYKNVLIKAEIWGKLAADWGTDTENIKTKWKTLKDTYVSFKKHRKYLTGQSVNKQVKWNYAQQMEFLDPTLVSPESRSEHRWQDDAFDEDISQPTFPVAPALISTAKRGKPHFDGLFSNFDKNIGGLITEPVQQETPDEVFAKSLVCLMKDLPSSVKDKFQAETKANLHRLRWENALVVAKCL